MANPIEASSSEGHVGEYSRIEDEPLALNIVIGPSSDCSGGIETVVVEEVVKTGGAWLT